METKRVAGFGGVGKIFPSSSRVCVCQLAKGSEGIVSRAENQLQRHGAAWVERWEDARDRSDPFRARRQLSRPFCVRWRLWILGVEAIFVHRPPNPDANCMQIPVTPAPSIEGVDERLIHPMPNPGNGPEQQQHQQKHQQQ